jgi:hypothetical protein
MKENQEMPKVELELTEEQFNEFMENIKKPILGLKKREISLVIKKPKAISRDEFVLRYIGRF